MNSPQAFPWTIDAHKTFKPFLVGLFVISIIFAFFYDTWIELFVIGLPALVIPFLLINIAPNSFWSRHSVAMSAMIFSALNIHQMQGLIEIHFSIFAYLAAMVFYRDWRVIVTGVVVVLIYHVMFFVMQIQAIPVYLFEAGHLDFNYLVLHAFYAILEGCILVYICIRMHTMGIIGAELQQNIEQKMANEDAVQLSIKAQTYGEIKVLVQYNELFEYIDGFVTHSRHAVGELESGSQQLKQRIDNITEMKDQESVHTDSIAASTEQMSSAIGEVADRANKANAKAIATLEMVNLTEAAVKESKQRINTFEKTIRETSSEISQLSDSCKEITSVVDGIQAIAEQTNLLALNAAIESARAGEHGRGFAVVADEVRQLSFRTTESTGKITQIMNDLLTKSNSSVSAMQSSLVQLEQMLESSAQVENYIENASLSVQEVSENIELVATATEQKAASAHTIALSAGDVKKISDEERLVLIEIARTTTELHNLTDTLRRAIARFG
ncbi:methyl-accepting chemotaxis protein [Catenovulum maritimum]|uniref:Methyl-accepting transducer domain-containing protein n=1 Tax=Catenovulum maritimum TaxID=1513271 RepID=A0A0J8GST5_9ALTE|nr:methyl-accepting chemotaxis protein [Catenovulum maritimum]KMT65812.1 hypothetical protein XM47_07390 [Catenovulum maritimum]